LIQKNFIWPSENEKIDDFIKKMQLNIESYHNNKIFEWIPYNQFNKIKEIGKYNSILVYSAIWEVGPLYINDQYSGQNSEYDRDSNKEVFLKCLQNSHNNVEFLINEV
jgi:hypothetical protein